jgi:dihydrofolate synthase/folylpolyglutamate synthase
LKASTFNLKGKTFENVNAAISTALQHARKDDLILVCGSVFLVGEVNTVNGEWSMVNGL